MFPTIAASLLLSPAALVDLCGHDDWRTREAATVRLSASLRHAGPALLDGLRSRDAEVRRRCERVAAALWELRLVEAARAVDAYWCLADHPFLDSCWLDRTGRNYDPSQSDFAMFAWENWRPYIGLERDDHGMRFGRYRAASRRVAVEVHGWGCPLWAIEAVYRVLRERDRRYLAGSDAAGVP
jgi:hypothetical protein